MDSPSLVRQIPLEVFLQISSYLTTPDLGSLRLTCKHAESSLFETFGREFFTKRQFMLSETSLQALIDISKHQRLSQFLSHVIIGLDSFKNATRSTSIGGTASTNRLDTGLADELALLSTGQDREMLALALRNLPNLQTVGLRDYNSGWRARDNDKWHSYGAMTIFHETGVRMLDGHIAYARHDDTHFASRAFSSLLYALGQSGVKPQAFEILLRKPGLGLPYDAFKIPNFYGPSVMPLLFSLKTLLLTIQTWGENYDGNDEDPDVEYPDSPLRQYLHHTSNLTHLRINFLTPLRSNAERFMDWLGRPASLNTFTGSPLSKSIDPVALSHLQRLDIGMLTVSPRTLLAIIHKFKPTLRSLSLWKIDLKFEDPQHQAGKKSSPWPKVFARLPDLDYLSVGCIGQLFPSGRHRLGFKVPGDQSGEPDVTRVCSRNSDMALFRNKLREDLFVTWPEGGSLSGDESMSDDDSDSDIDMDDDYVDDDE